MIQRSILDGSRIVHPEDGEQLPRNEEKERPDEGGAGEAKMTINQRLPRSVSEKCGRAT